MIKSVEYENFKAFKKSGNVDLKKINILVGPNSSGKSSFIKGLLTLKNSIESKDTDPLTLNKEIGNYKSVVYGNNIKEKLTYKLEFAPEHVQKQGNQETRVGIILFNIARNIDKLIIDNTFDSIFTGIMKKITRYVIKEVKFTIKNTASSRIVVENFDMVFTNGQKCKIFMNRNSYYISFNDYQLSKPNLVKPHKFYFRISEDKLKNLNVEELEYLAIIDYAFNCIGKNINNFTNSIIHMEPFRNKPDRVEYLTNLKSFNTVGTKGENTLTTLLALDNSDVKNKINDWLNVFHLADKIDIEKLGNDTYSMLIKNKNTGIVSNILDVGVGTSQLLPIIIESVNSKEGSVLIIEEPEIHIHPSAQARLADLFVDCAKNQNKKFIIETHSVFLIMQLEILVAQGKTIDADDVRVYYFDQDKDGTKIIDMKLSSNGQFEEEWPSGFFDNHYILGNKLFSLI